LWQLNRNDLNLRGYRFGSKRKFGRSYFTVLVDKGYHKEIAQCLSNNITTIVAPSTPGTSKESVTTGLFVAKFK
jgi:hypothetical protein